MKFCFSLCVCRYVEGINHKLRGEGYNGHSMLLNFSTHFPSSLPIRRQKGYRNRESEREVAKCDREMKRGLESGGAPVGGAAKRQRRKAEGGGDGGETEAAFVNLDEDLLFEVLKHVDARTLATAACVSRQWKSTAHDERLWEMICTRQWANVGCGSQQLRSVVLALGGFRRLHALCLWPLLKSPASSSPYTTPSHSPRSSSSPFSPPVVSPKKAPTRWGKDEVNLSLSLLSIRFYEKMSSKSKGS